MNAEEIYRELATTRTSIEKLDAPSKPGVYAVFVREDASLISKDVRLEGMIYIGSSGNLAQREYDTDCCSGKTGFSTLRRSIGAILKEQLQLKAIPRGRSSSPSNYRNYQFRSRDEQSLTRWMNNNLEIAICPIDGNYKIVKADLISELNPVLCLKGWNNPYSKILRKLRKICADESRKVNR